MILYFDTDVLPKVRFIGSVSYKEPWKHFARVINEYVLYVIKSGELYIREADREYALKKGDILLLEPNVLHEGFKFSSCDYFFIHFKHPGIRAAGSAVSAKLTDEILHNRKTSLTSDALSDTTVLSSICFLPKYYHIKNETVLFSFFNNLEESIGDYCKKYEDYKKVIACNLMKLLIKLSREFITTEIENSETYTPKSFLKVKKIIDYINKRYNEKLTSKDLETLFDSNYDYLNRVFRTATGNTIVHYINNVRVNKAKELIESTSMNFSQICYVVGINNPYYFTRLFKKYTGMTPSQYSKKIVSENIR